MDLLREGFAEAWRLIAAGDETLLHALRVSLTTSLLAVAVAAVAAVPFGAWLGLFRPRGHRACVFLIRLALGVPTVVIGLFVWMLITRQGLLGSLDLFMTQTAITIGQALLAFPLLASQVHAATASLDPRVRETALTLGAGKPRALTLALGEARPALVVAFLYAFSRCVTEVGIAFMVGGGVKMHTRTLPAAIMLEVHAGDLGKALAPAIVLMALGAVVVLLAPLVLRERRA